MSTATDVELRTRLLSLVGVLASSTDPVDGIEQSMAQAVKGEVEGLLRDTRMSWNTRQHLLSAASSLSSNALTLSTSLSALQHLANALKAAEEASASTASPAFSRFPAELIAHVVRDCQDNDPRLRQNTNVALASTCRAFHVAVQPILRREMHLFTPGQIERAYRSVEDFSARTRAVVVMSVDVGPDKLSWQGDGSWAGRRLPELIAQCDHIKALRLRFETMDYAASNALGHLHYLLGLDYEHTYFDWLELPHLRELDLPLLDNGDNISFSLERLFKPPANLRSFRLGDGSCPIYTSAAEIDRTIHSGEIEVSNEDVTHYELFCAPFLAFFPSHLLRIIRRPVDDPDPRLQQLEITIVLNNYAGDVDSLCDAITALSPSLRHLALRLKCTTSRLFNQNAFDDKLLSALQTCSLAHLEIGGKPISLSTLERISRLRTLRTLVILPIPDTPPVNHLRWDVLNCADPPLERLVICIRKITLDSYAGFERAAAIANMLDFEFAPGTVEVEERQAEFEWLGLV
ncbi:hypothetical protein JCM10207_005254 [Rhodosporidiobolus poonsookiae]